MDNMARIILIILLLCLVHISLSQESTTTASSHYDVPTPQHTTESSLAVLAPSTFAPTNIGEQEEKFSSGYELSRMLRLQYTIEHLDVTGQKQWLSDEDIATSEVDAVIMVHNSLLSHADSIRCPVYAMVLSWFVDLRQDANRAHDPSRHISRYSIQMLAYRAALEPAFYHDRFFVPRFWSLARHFVRVAEDIERTGQQVAITIAWYDLVSCLFEYGNLPMPEDLGPVRAVQSFLLNESRRRKTMRIRSSEVSRDIRADESDIKTLHSLASSTPQLDTESALVVEAMMDKQTRDAYRTYKMLHLFGQRPRAAVEEARPIWPSNLDPQIFDPTIDFEPLPVLVYKFYPREATRWALRVEPFDRGSHVPESSSSSPMNSRDHRLRVIASYYQLRLRLVTLLEQDDGFDEIRAIFDMEMPVPLWSRLPIESTFEYAIILEALQDDQLRHHSTTAQMSSGLNDYRAVVSVLERIKTETYQEPEHYLSILRYMSGLLNRMNPIFNVNILTELLAMMENLKNLFQSIKSVVRTSTKEPADVAESSQAGENRASRTASGSDNEENCAVCLESLDAFANQSFYARQHHKPIELNCGHKFHWSCMYEWFSSSLSRTCPLCRRAR